MPRLVIPASLPLPVIPSDKVHLKGKLQFINSAHCFIRFESPPPKDPIKKGFTIRFYIDDEHLSGQGNCFAFDERFPFKKIPRSIGIPSIRTLYEVFTHSMEDNVLEHLSIEMAKRVRVIIEKAHNGDVCFLLTFSSGVWPFTMKETKSLKQFKDFLIRRS